MQLAVICYAVIYKVGAYDPGPMFRVTIQKGRAGSTLLEHAKDDQVSIIIARWQQLKLQDLER
jgi:hypothetical protein